MIDLHTHTTASDGTLSLEELVSEAKRAGLKAIAITDHDNVQSAAKITGKEPIETIPGIELSVHDAELGYEDVHMLGLFIDPEHKALNLKLSSLGREEQKKATIARLRDMGYEITFEEVKAKAKGVVGRPHISMVLMEKYPDEFPSMTEVFSRLLARGKPAYVGREVGFGLGEAISLIREAGGLSFLCHPFIYPYDTKKLLRDFKNGGGIGVESYYDYIRNRPLVKITEEENTKLIQDALALADEFGLLPSGGSDFHGSRKKGQRLGAFGAPDEVLEKIKAARGKAL